MPLSTASWQTEPERDIWHNASSQVCQFYRDDEPVIVSRLPSDAACRHIDSLVKEARHGSSWFQFSGAPMEPILQRIRLNAKGMKKVSLCGSQLGNKEAKRLATAIGDNRFIEQVDLSHNQIGDEGVIALLKELPSQLHSLNLEGNPIGEEGVKAFRNLNGKEIRWTTPKSPISTPIELSLPRPVPFCSYSQSY